jgi:hypothetical protein
VGGGLLAHDGQLDQPGTAAAVLLGEVDADEAVMRQVFPEFVGGLVCHRPLGEVVRAVFVGDRADGMAQFAVFG